MSDTTARLRHLDSHTRTRRALSRRECRDVLHDIGWGVLGVVERTPDAAVPVGVPIAYAFDAERVYLAMSPGRKLRALQRNPRLCLTVADVRALHDWRSVLVIGEPRWISESSERRSAIALYVTQARRGTMQLTHDDEARLDDAQLLTIDIDEIHGFASIGAAPARAAAADVMNALRRIVGGLRAAEKHAKNAFGLTPAQLFVLREIAKADTLSVGELAIRTATAQSSVSEVVAHLETRGLAARARSSADARRTEITLTAEGRAILVRATDTIQERLLSAFARLPRSAQHDAAKVLGAWLDEAGLGGAEATMFFEP